MWSLSAPRIARLKPMGRILEHEARQVSLPGWNLKEVVDAKYWPKVLVRIAPQAGGREQIRIASIAAARVALRKQDGLRSTVDERFAVRRLTLGPRLRFVHVVTRNACIRIHEHQVVGGVATHRP